jgi:hypothetical protein
LATYVRNAGGAAPPDPTAEQTKRRRGGCRVRIDIPFKAGLVNSDICYEVTASTSKNNWEKLLNNVNMVYFALVCVPSWKLGSWERLGTLMEFE